MPLLRWQRALWGALRPSRSSRLLRHLHQSPLRLAAPPCSRPSSTATIRRFATSVVPALEVTDFTPKDADECEAVVDAYLRWWDSLKFRRGWETPAFESSDVWPLLERAAEYVVRIRLHLDRTNPGMKLRMKEGAAHHFFETQKGPPSDAEGFVRDLVHATFKDARGYVEGLTAELVDSFIRQMDSQLGMCCSPPMLPLPQQLKEVQGLLTALEGRMTSLVPPQQTALAQAAEPLRQQLQQLLAQLDASASSPSQSATTSTTEGREPQPPPVEEAAPDPAAIEITRVGREVLETKEAVQSLVEACAGLTADSLVRDAGQAEALLDRLQERCVTSSDKLMADLLSLDRQIASDPQMRQQKKSHVAAINDLLGTIEQLSYKLSALRQVMEKEREQKEAEAQRKAEEARRREELARQQQQREAEEAARQAEAARREAEAAAKAEQARHPETASDAARRHDSVRQAIERLHRLLLDGTAWRRLPLRPKFDVVERPEAYLVQAHIPGLRREAVSIDLVEGTDQLAVSGHVEPTPEEAQEIVGDVIRGLRAGNTSVLQLLSSSDEELLTHLGAGRYGSFSQRYHLPAGVRADTIKGRLQDEWLVVAVPKATVMRPGLVPHASPYFGPPSWAGRRR